MITQIPTIPELDYQVVMDALKGYAYPRKAHSDLLARGKLQRLKKGLYIQAGPGIPPFSREILGNMIYGPSYISREYALSYHGLIPEHVVEITSVTSRKTKIFTTPVGSFSYIHVPTHYYSFGFGLKEIGGERAFLIADPEKAIADRVLMEKGRFSIRSMKTFLFDNLRIDPDEFRNLDKSCFSQVVHLIKRQSLDVLCRVREEM